MTLPAGARRARDAGAWAAVLALAAAPWIAAARRGARPWVPAAECARALARWEWIAASGALRSGQRDLALARARAALTLDPGDTEGWEWVARQLAYEFGSSERAPSPGQRSAWMRSALDVARRGEASAREPGALALWQGLLMVRLAMESPPLPWDGGRVGMWRAAQGHFERAVALGNAEATEFALRAAARAAAGEGTRSATEREPDNSEGDVENAHSHR